MANLYDIRTKVANKLSDGLLVRPTSEQIDAAINSSIAYYENNYFWFQEGSYSYTLADEQAELSPLPEDFKFQRSPNDIILQATDSKVKEKLVFLHPVEFDKLSIRWSSRYMAYTFRDGKIEIYPTKGHEGDVLTLYYWKSYTDLVNDEDENDFTIHASRLIETKTMLDCLIDYKQEDARISVYYSKEKDELRTIKRETYNRTSTGRLITENIILDNSNNINRNYTSWYR